MMVFGIIVGAAIFIIGYGIGYQNGHKTALLKCSLEIDKMIDDARSRKGSQRSFDVK